MSLLFFQQAHSENLAIIQCWLWFSICVAGRGAQIDRLSETKSLPTLLIG